MFHRVTTSPAYHSARTLRPSPGDRNRLLSLRTNYAELLRPLLSHSQLEDVFLQKREPIILNLFYVKRVPFFQATSCAVIGSTDTTQVHSRISLSPVSENGSHIAKGTTRLCTIPMSASLREGSVTRSPCISPRFQVTVHLYACVK